jgi:hypothetical protein
MINFAPRRLAILLMLCGLAAIAAPATSALTSEAIQTLGPTVVTVDFRVLTKDGNPVLDLKPGDVALKVGGRAREIVALEPMQVGGGPAAKPVVDEPPAPFVTNEPPVGGGRDVMIVVDDDAIAPGRETATRTAVGHLLDALVPADRVSWQVPKNPAARVQLTARRDAVRAAVAGLTGRSGGNEAATDAACRTLINLNTLLETFENVVPSVPTVVVFVSNGFTPPTGMDTLARKSGAGPAGPCEVTTRELESLTNAVVASRAQFFAVQVVDDVTSGTMGTTDISGGLEHIAGLTGNTIVRLIGNTAPLMKRIATETSAYYLAAVEIPAEERNGSTQRVEVTVARPGVIVRARPSIVIPKPGGARAKSEAVKVRDLLSVAKVFRDLPLRALAYTSRASPDGKVKVMCVFEGSDPSQPLAAAAVALFDDKGTARAQWTAQPNDLKRRPMMAALTAPAAGTYRVRVAAADAAGASGTVDQDVKIEAASGVSLGALALGVQGASGFAPRLQFVTEPVAIAVVEIYGVSKTSKVTAIFELAGSESGPTVRTLNATIVAPREDLRMAHAALPIGPMPPGDLVLRAVVTVDGEPLAARPVHTLHKGAQ